MRYEYYAEKGLLNEANLSFPIVLLSENQNYSIRNASRVA